MMWELRCMNKRGGGEGGSRGGPTMDLCVTDSKCDGSVLEHLSPANVLWVGLQSLSSLLCGVSVSFDITEQRHLMSGPLETRHWFSCPIISRSLCSLSLHFLHLVWKSKKLLWCLTLTQQWSSPIQSGTFASDQGSGVSHFIISGNTSSLFVKNQRRVCSTVTTTEANRTGGNFASSSRWCGFMLSNINNYFFKLMVYFR